MWNPDRQATFEDLKQQLTRAPILSPPNWTTEFYITIDASGWCIGAILWQRDSKKRENVVFYASRKMSSAEKKYTITEKEALVGILVQEI